MNLIFQVSFNWVYNYVFTRFNLVMHENNIFMRSNSIKVHNEIKNIRARTAFKSILLNLLVILITHVYKDNILRRHGK